MPNALSLLFEPNVRIIVLYWFVSIRIRSIQRARLCRVIDKYIHCPLVAVHRLLPTPTYRNPHWSSLSITLCVLRRLYHLACLSNWLDDTNKSRPECIEKLEQYLTTFALPRTFQDTSLWKAEIYEVRMKSAPSTKIPLLIQPLCYWLCKKCLRASKRNTCRSHIWKWMFI